MALETSSTFLPIATSVSAACCGSSFSIRRRASTSAKMSLPKGRTGADSVHIRSSRSRSESALRRVWFINT